MKLSKAQRETIAKMEMGKTYCARDLRCSRNTLNALERRGLVKSKYTLGYLFSPRTEILFRLTEAGQKVKNAEGLKNDAR
jgi:hypothetical protein